MQVWNNGNADTELTPTSTVLYVWADTCGLYRCHQTQFWVLLWYILDYLYKNILPVGFLGLVDDIVGITEAGCKAQMLNAFMNIKSTKKKTYNLVPQNVNQY